MRLNQVKHAPKSDASDILSLYMGKNTPNQKDYIRENLVVPGGGLTAGTEGGLICQGIPIRTRSLPVFRIVSHRLAHRGGQRDNSVLGDNKSERV